MIDRLAHAGVPAASLPAFLRPSGRLFVVATLNTTDPHTDHPVC
ncbi:hypothetical protein CLV70_119133 [Pseudosporangium ferrugineum]|uniref:Uncharacterized protein n=1 Tax=Pseudosporangium ferrugineum TaxID=439699 RepID=A0A2T0RKQ6_9ACTN|nr:hypothetical protein CLV70_119133 [Pseudosporangium ferrugineum]